MRGKIASQGEADTRVKLGDAVQGTDTVDHWLYGPDLAPEVATAGGDVGGEQTSILRSRWRGNQTYSRVGEDRRVLHGTLRIN